MLKSRLFWIFPGLCLFFQAYAAELEIHNAWVREAPPMAKNHVAYLQIKNVSDQDRELVAIDTNDYADTMLHQIILDKDITSMKHLPVLKIPAHSSVALEPGGVHVMLMQPKRLFKSGDVIKLVLRFDDSTEITVDAPVRK